MTVRVGRHRAARAASNGVRRLVLALADVGPSSAASLVVGLLAVRQLDATGLGVYSLLFSCAFLVGVAPTQLVFLPRERAVATELVPPGDAARHAWRVVGRAVLVGAACSVVTVAIAAHLYRQEHSPGTLQLGAGALALGIASPVQDYVRRLAHILHRGVVAVVTSWVQLLTVLLLAVLAVVAEQDLGALLIAGLAISNAVSAAVGLGLLARARDAGREPAEHGVPGATAQAGSPAVADPSAPDGHGAEAAAGSAARARVAGGLLPDVTFTIGNLLIERLGGLALVGAAEAARQLAQPVMLIGVAASNVLARSALRAGAFGDVPSARKGRLLVSAGAAAAVAVVLAVCYLPPTSGLLRDFAPVAFSQPGLLLLTCLAHGAVVVGMVLTLELVGAHRERSFLTVEGVVAVVQLAVCTAAGALGASSRPASVLASGVVRLGLARTVLARSYARAARPAPAQPVGTGAGHGPVPSAN